MTMLNVTNGNNTLQGPGKSQHGFQWGWRHFSLPWPQRHLPEEPGEGALAFTACHMPCPSPSWAPGGVFCGRCLGGEVGESTSFLLGCREMSGFVQVTLMTKLVGPCFSGRLGKSAAPLSCRTSPPPPAVTPGWLGLCLPCMACMRKSGSEFNPRKLKSQFISLQKHQPSLWSPVRQSSTKLRGSGPTCILGTGSSPSEY